jgi:hypothetical protein
MRPGFSIGSAARDCRNCLEGPPHCTNVITAKWEVHDGVRGIEDP